MIRTLSIKNYILIEELNVEFHNGFSTIIGETGAGKSIIIEAISLLLGKRADPDVLLDKTKKCVIEAEFYSNFRGLKDYLNKKEIDVQGNYIIIRREILPNAKSRAFVNDTPVTLNILKEISDKLIDLHSQNENLSLSLNKYRIKIIDIAAGTANLYKEYLIKFNKYREYQKQLTDIQNKLSEKIKDIDYYKFQYEQIKNAELNDDNELKYLEEKSMMLENSSEIKESLTKSVKILEGDEFSVESLLKEVRLLINKLSGKYPKALEISERLETFLLEIRDIANILYDDAENAEINPELLEQVNSRLDLINSLLQKHRVENIKELKTKAEEFASYITGTQDLEDAIKELSEKLKKEKEELVTLSAELSKKREAVFESFSNSITDLLINLGIKDAVFKIRNNKNSDFDINGIDNIEFLFSANKNFEPQPLENVASGGEFSRLMLSLKSNLVLASGVETVVFDEVDTGVSGEIALKVGKMMKQLSNTVQVISITHLPQIAALGDNQYKVFKNSDNKNTYTGISLLEYDERIKEIALMIGGESITNEAIQAAKVLLGK